ATVRRSGEVDTLAVFAAQCISAQPPPAKARTVRSLPGSAYARNPAVDSSSALINSRPSDRISREMSPGRPGPQQFARLHGMALDSKVHLYLADAGNQWIDEFDSPDPSQATSDPPDHDPNNSGRNCPPLSGTMRP